MTVNEKRFFNNRRFFIDHSCFLKRFLSGLIKRYVHFEAADLNELKVLSDSNEMIIYVAQKSSVIEQFIFNVFLLLKELKIPFWSFGPSLFWNYSIFKPVRTFFNLFCRTGNEFHSNTSFYITVTKNKNEISFGWASYFTKFSGKKAVIVPVTALWNKDVASQKNKQWHWLFPLVGKYNIWTNSWQLFLFIIRRRKLSLRFGLHSDIKFSALSQENEKIIYDIASKETKKVVGAVLKNWYDIRNETLMELSAGNKDISKETLEYLNKISMRYSPHFTDTLHRLTGRIINRIALIDIPDTEIDWLRKNVSSRDSVFIFVPTHKSYMDHIFLFNLLYIKQLTVPLVLSGDNLDFFPLGRILRKTGAVFIKRKSRELTKYNNVLKTYLKHIVQTGYNIEFFPEGGRSRFGKVRSVRSGILRMFSEIQQELDKHIFIIPVSITYENLPDIMSYRREFKLGKEGENRNFSNKIKSFFTFNYGKTYINFSKPVPVLSETDNRFIRQIGFMLERNSTIPVSSLIAACMITTGKISTKELYKKILLIKEILSELGWIKFSSETENYSFFEAIIENYLKKEMLFSRNEASKLSINSCFSDYFTYYSNIISAAVAPFFICDIQNKTYFHFANSFLSSTIRGFSENDISTAKKVKTGSWFTAFAKRFFLFPLKELLWVAETLYSSETLFYSSEDVIAFLKKQSFTGNLIFNTDSLYDNIIFLKEVNGLNSNLAPDKAVLEKIIKNATSSVSEIKGCSL